MKVVYLSSEVVPFAKTGGLADISSLIPKTLNKLGVDCIVIMPYYNIVRNCDYHIEKTNIQVTVRVGDTSQAANIYKSCLAGSSVPIYFLDNNQYFGRDGLYNYPGTTTNYEDNGERFAFFSRAALELIIKLKLYPEIIHCNDWQTALVPVYLKTVYEKCENFRHTKTVMAIHNLAYQGLFSPENMKCAGLDWSLFNWKQLEFFGMMNFLKGGIVFADVITTVSKTYAQEIQTPEYGAGLDGVLMERAKDIYGFINGVDYSVWNPETDKFIAANYSVEDLYGKKICKSVLQKKLGLPEKEVPVFAMISRLTNQKGLDLLIKIFKRFIALDVQFVLLGTGERTYQDFFRDYAGTFPSKVVAKLAFDERLAHEIEAGADIYLMPSRYEPCGLNQLYSLRYGTVPIVRRTGGLADTIIDVQYGRIYNEIANGFSFKNYDADLLYATMLRAVDYFQNKEKWTNLMKTGMKQRWPWEKSAKNYITLYEQLLKN